jgi:hypothetical protein
MVRVNRDKARAGSLGSGSMVESLERREMFASSYVAPPPPPDGAVIAILQPAQTAAGAQVDYYMSKDAAGAQVDFYVPKDAAGAQVDYFLPAAQGWDWCLPAKFQPPPAP